MTVATAARDFEAADGLFTTMRERNVTARGQTYLKYISGCFEAKEPERAYQMLKDMETQWRVPDVRDYRTMLQSFQRLGHREGVMSCVRALLMTTPHQRGPGIERQLVHSLFTEA